jgi:hypothetical protein
LALQFRGDTLTFSELGTFLNSICQINLEARRYYDLVADDALFEPTPPNPFIAESLRDWVMGLEVSDLPTVPIELRPGERVSDGAMFLWNLKNAVMVGESHPRAISGALQDDVGRLREMINQRGSGNAQLLNKDCK